MRLKDFLLEYAEAAEQLMQEQKNRQKNMSAQIAQRRHKRR